MRSRSTSQKKYGVRATRSNVWTALAMGVAGGVAVLVALGSARTGGTAATKDLGAPSRSPSSAPALTVGSPLAPAAFRARRDDGDIPSDRLVDALAPIVASVCAAEATFAGDATADDVALERAMAASVPAREALLARYDAHGVLRFAEPRLGEALVSRFGLAEPCTALVVTWALSKWPEGARVDVLQGLVERPPGESLFVALTAVGAMAETGERQHVATLVDLLDGKRGSRLLAQRFGPP